MKKRVYVETSVISYLTARQSRDIILLGRQRITATWWERRDEWECCLSPAVLDEIEAGDPIAAQRRMTLAGTLRVLPVIPEANALADLLVACSLIPASVLSDALHLALAAVHEAQYLLTWNQKHLSNPTLRSRIEAAIEQQGFLPALVITPEQILEE
ncbi:MAG: type II toxin-antitoxin system VapC family toxin [Synergistaceae bacterium]|jgi:predicted nucleic acid-binding protein|nr:type II toxin-antitoxin system VapC family toxin [Synergistaceae bacterium]